MKRILMLFWEQLVRSRRCVFEGLDTMAPIEDFEAIAMGHLPAIQRAAVAICGRTGVADDMVQTTLLKAYERFDSFEAGTNCKAWLLCILRNSWVDYLRVQQRRLVKQVPLEEELVADRQEGPVPCPIRIASSNLLMSLQLT